MRLFIALPLTGKVERTLENIITVLKKSGGKIKWVDPKNIHLTLKFLGEADESLVDGISSAIEEISRKYDPIESVLNKVGAFPNPNKPRVIWAGMAEEIENLIDLASDIDNEMSKFDFEKETRKFKSHLTLGRVKDNRNLGEIPEAIKNYKMSAEQLIFDRIVLFKSQLTPQGPIYSRLYEAQLKASQTFS